MTSILLFLKGEPFQTIEIDLLPWDKKLSKDKVRNFQLNVTLRKYQVDSNIQALKALYWKQIQKVNYDYEVMVILQSKIK